MLNGRPEQSLREDKTHAGLFITFEGPEGSGKSTQIELLAESIRRGQRKVIIVREPGSTEIGSAVRSILMDHAHQNMSPRAEALLFNAARAQLVDEVIRPALAQYVVVLCDRYADSTLAYQGYGRRQDISELRLLGNYATGLLQPHVTVYLDIDPATGLARKQQDQSIEWNRLDAETLSFHQTVRAGYLELAAEEPDRWLIVDAAQSIDEVQCIIQERVFSKGMNP